MSTITRLLIPILCAGLRLVCSQAFKLYRKSSTGWNLPRIVCPKSTASIGETGILTSALNSSHNPRTGKWLPQDYRIHKEWLGDVIEYVDSYPKELHAVIKEFRDMIEEDTRIYLLFSSMFEQIPSKKPYNNDPTGHRQIRDCDHMLQVLNHLLTTAPSWSSNSERVGLVGLPINALLDWPMATKSGFATFLDPKVNAMLKKVLKPGHSTLSLQLPERFLMMTSKAGSVRMA
jgi:Phophatidylserine decarboxylase